MRPLRIFAALTLLGSSLAAQAESGGAMGTIDYTAIHPLAYNLLLADSSAPTAAAQKPSPIAAEEGVVFKEPWFTRNKAHQYLGLGSLTLATLALLSPKEEEGPHEFFAKGAAALGGAAVASGLVFHWEDVGLSNGISDPDNLHALLSTLGALGFLAAVSQAPEEGHAVAGALGYTAMAIGIRITW